MFPSDYPFKPPAIRMTTPSGRFKTNTRLCLSISDYHPKTWNPAWSVSTILTGLLSFMVSDESTAGSIMTTEEDRRRYARQSRRWNLTNNAAFRLHFPEEVKKNQELIEKMNEDGTTNMSIKKGTSKNRDCTARRPEGIVDNINEGIQQGDRDNGAPNAAQNGKRSMSRNILVVCLAVVGWAMAAKFFQ